MLLRRLEISFEDDGTLRGTRGHYVTVDSEGRETALGTRRLSEQDLVTAIPDSASLLSRVDALTAENTLIRDQLRTQDQDAPVSRGQFIAGLDQYGLLDGINAYFAGLADDAAVAEGVTGKDAKLRWTTALYFSPTEPLLIGIATQQFGLTTDQLANMFQWARENVTPVGTPIQSTA